MFEITWVSASPSVRGMEAARSKSERASVNTKMFRAGKFLRTSMSKNTGKDVNPISPWVFHPSSLIKEKNIFFQIAISCD